MIATVDIADVGARRTLMRLLHRPHPEQVRGLRWLDIALAVPLTSRVPTNFGRAAMIALWDDENAAAAFAASHPVADRFASGVHATLRPLRAFGSWPGLDGDIPRSRITQHDGPVLVVTLGRLRVSQTVRFMRASRPAQDSAVAADGFIWGTAAARPPFMATVSVWANADAAASYAYTPPTAGHSAAITEQRRKDFHKQSAFIRFAPIEIHGSLDRQNPFATEAVSEQLL